MTLLHRKKAWLSFQFYKLHVGEIRHTEAVDVDGETTPVFSWCLGANINRIGTNYCLPPFVSSAVEIRLYKTRVTFFRIFVSVCVYVYVPLCTCSENLRTSADG